MKKILSLIALIAFVMIPAASWADVKEDLAKLQGTWTGKIETDQFTADITMEIKESKVVFTIKSSNGEMKIKSDLKLEQVGKFKIFTYANAENESGEKIGEGESRSSIYRLDGDTLATAGGFGEGDQTPANLIRWTKK